MLQELRTRLYETRNHYTSDIRDTYGGTATFLFQGYTKPIGQSLKWYCLKYENLKPRKEERKSGEPTCEAGAFFLGGGYRASYSYVV
jgi:hypothetical protein